MPGFYKYRSSVSLLVTGEDFHVSHIKIWQMPKLIFCLYKCVYTFKFTIYVYVCIWHNTLCKTVYKTDCEILEKEHPVHCPSRLEQVTQGTTDRNKMNQTLVIIPLNFSKVQDRKRKCP